MQNRESDLYEFDFGPMALFFNYSHILILLGLLAAGAAEFIARFKFYPDVIKMFPAVITCVGVIVFLPLYGFIRVLFHKMAYKVTLNMHDNDLTLWVLFKKEPLHIPLSDLKSVRMKWTINYVLTDGTIIRGMNTEKAFIDFLRKNNIDVEWVGYGKLRKKHYI
ncbi:hypothetical protein [Desulfatibacillum aliphaticivorans]|uniref:hypothetical protein n=1 Tax=Desulfatibacillum aliphaticivorans TaxID=218208 RepID=UPI0003F7FBF5|nr:hypothetical protein [Desulfatibacillum aliphaticivorans]